MRNEAIFKYCIYLFLHIANSNTAIRRGICNLSLEYIEWKNIYRYIFERCLRTYIKHFIFTSVHIPNDLPQSSCNRQPCPESKLPPGPANSQYGQAQPTGQWQFPLLLQTCVHKRKYKGFDILKILIRGILECFFH